MTLQEIQSRLYRAIDARGAEIIALGEEIGTHPELGYREEYASATVRRVFDRCGIPYEYPLAVTGVKGQLAGRTDGPTVCVMGEMDALQCARSPLADKEGIAHACGHNAQLAAMLGCAVAFAESGVLAELDGTLTFLAAPAEEFIDLDFRRSLQAAGRIRYPGGKQQLIAEGAFDDADMALMLHAKPAEPAAKVFVRGQNLGFTAETVTFRGKAVHGSTPFDGVNALNAAALAILGIHANRETFREEEKIRIHPIITKGGDVVNAVPDEVVIDTYVRGASLAAIRKGEAAVRRGVQGAAAMVGASAEIHRLPGYLPLYEDEALSAVFAETAAGLIGEDNIRHGEDIVGSTDAGDLSHLIPVIQPSVGGFAGDLHSTAFSVSRPETAYVLSAKLLAGTAAALLFDHAQAAHRVKDAFIPRLTKEDYIRYLNGEDVIND